MGNYPRVVVDIEKFKNNVEQIVSRCSRQNIKVAGVIKGYNGIPECTKAFAEADVEYIATSRLEQIEAAQKTGVKKPYMLIRVPMLTEIKEVIALTDISLNSEVAVLKALDQEARRQNKKHKVILMVDLGDLREGFWEKEELLKTAIWVEEKLENIELAGIGTNLGCYGSIAATKGKLQELVDDAEVIEKKIGRELEFISGGATSSIPRVIEGNMPERINLLRIGEGIILGRDLEELYGYDMSFMDKDAFTLEAEIIEVKDKPSHPVGEIAYDAFGMKQEYEDRGIRKRALVALGKVDYAFEDKLYPRDKDIVILGGSSDHTILDIEDCFKEYKVGDTVEFDLCYATIVYATNSPNVKIQFK